VTELVADPSGIVASEQPVHFRIGFTVPNDIYIGHAIVEINTSWNGIQVPTQRSGLGTYLPLPLTSRAYVIDYNTTFPPKIWGRINTQVSVFNESGTELLCAQWIVYATGTAKNETGWPLSALYTA
jgi:hypothetical protein